MIRPFWFCIILNPAIVGIYTLIFCANPLMASTVKPSDNGFTTMVINKLSITVVYDNNPYKEGLTTSWGFACVIRGVEKTILFDTGGSSAVLLGNMQQLGIDPKEIDIVVLSHIHGDHVGGLDGLLKENSEMAVYFPATFPAGFKKSLKQAGIRASEVSDPAIICKDVYSTGVLGSWMKEQALIISTDRGLIVITGCAHPGIVKILKTAREMISAPILLVIGGFHLGAIPKQQLEKIIVDFRELGVQNVGPCHCTGDPARRMFEEEYGKDFLEVGVGRLIEFEQ